jgi:hypothetical protein
MNKIDQGIPGKHRPRTFASEDVLRVRSSRSGGGGAWYSSVGLQ